MASSLFFTFPLLDSNRIVGSSTTIPHKHISNRIYMSTTDGSSKEQSSSVIGLKFDEEDFWSRTEAKDQPKQSRYRLDNSGYAGPWEVGRAEPSKSSRHAAHHNKAMETFRKELGKRIPLTSRDASHDDCKSYSAQLRDLQRLVGPLAEELSESSHSTTITIEGGEVDPRLLRGAGIPCSSIWISVTSQASGTPSMVVKRAVKGVGRALKP